MNLLNKKNIVIFLIFFLFSCSHNSSNITTNPVEIDTIHPHLKKYLNLIILKESDDIDKNIFLVNSYIEDSICQVSVLRNYFYVETLFLGYYKIGNNYFVFNKPFDDITELPFNDSLLEKNIKGILLEENDCNSIMRYSPKVYRLAYINDTLIPMNFLIFPL